MSYLRLENINKSFGAVQVLNNINLTAEEGDFVVLLGPSGCGKSTLLRLITGLIEDHEGDIFIGDRDVTPLDPKDRKVAMVFQSYALYPHLTISKNISFGMEIKRLPKPEREQRVLEAARALQLEPLLKRYPAQLSGGQRQRVAIARCLVREPDLFLFDEPLSNLDAKLRNETRIELKQLHQRLGATTVYVTHDQHEAMTLASKVVLMKDGNIIQAGPPMALYDDPVDRFTATFLGSPQINLVRGQLETTDDGLLFSNDSMSLNLPSGILKKPFTGTCEVDFAVRAENAELADNKPIHLNLPVDFSEATGADIYINGKLNSAVFTVRLAKSANVLGHDILPIHLHLEQTFIFDAATGARL